MSKEKLKFKIAGKTIVYEGLPVNQQDDLMAILAKMNVSEATVVPTFRQNISNEGEYTDGQIMDLFKQSVQARAERKKRKDGDGGNNSSTKAVEPEKKQKLTLTYKGKQFSYEGLPSSKKHAVLELLIKQPDFTKEIGIATYRENIPSEDVSDAEILQMIDKAREAREIRKVARKTRGSGADMEVDTAEGLAAVDELTTMSVEEREAISNFIRQVLDQPAGEYVPPPREEPKPAPAMDELDTSRNKIAVYCQQGGNNAASKVIYVTPAITFAEFREQVTRKFPDDLMLSFYEGDDIIELDDEDVFSMFLEMGQQDGRKLKLICSSPETRKKHEDDKLTDITRKYAFRGKAFSNGELAVVEERTFTGHTLAVYCCAFSPSGDSFCTASRDRSIRLWNTHTGSCTVMKGGHNGFVLSCDFSPKGNRIVSASDDRTVKIWNTSTYSKVTTLKGHEDKVYCVQYSPNGDYIASASCDHTIRVWNAETFSKIVTLKGHTLAVFSCSFCHNRDGKFIASGSDDRMVKIWNWAEGKEVRSLVGHAGTVWSCNYSHSDAYIVSASMDHELKVWDVTNGTCLQTITGHTVPIHCALFSTNDKYIYSCARDWTVMVWNAETGERVETIMGHLSTVYHMDILGDRLLTSSLDDTVKLWTITPA